MTTSPRTSGRAAPIQTAGDAAVDPASAGGADRSSARPREIGIAIVVERGQVLVGIRGPHSPLPGYAEFPGGKCEPDEPPAECAIRECREETGLDVQIIDQLVETFWEYPHATVRLHFFLCRLVRPADAALDHSGFRWQPLAELSKFQFPEANRDAIAALASLGLERAG